MRRTIVFTAGTLIATATTVAAGEISGRVSVDGAPVSGVSVSAEPHQSPFERALIEARSGARPADLATAVTDHAGRFELRLEAEAGRVALRLEGPGLVP